ncbi:MAG TPA: metal-dependent transcriptional regulator [Myxococcales bacterium]|nr:metal-dependent transcriptional regulator [Myxococcales bacterium]
MKPRKIEELLETVYTEREQGRSDVEAVLAHAFEGHAEGKAPEDFRELERMGLCRLDGERVTLTGEGEARAALVVRRHRLAERLFSDLLALDDEHTEQQACEFEHVLSPEATDSVCTLLGHPPSCPHGKAIPPGACCAAFDRVVKPLVTGLASLPLGARGKIVFVAPRWADRMDRLAGLGVVPGTEIRLTQRSPSVVIEAGETTLALDPEVAAEIFVKAVA